MCHTSDQASFMAFEFQPDEEVIQVVMSDGVERVVGLQELADELKGTSNREGQALANQVMTIVENRQGPKHDDCSVSVAYLAPNVERACPSDFASQSRELQQKFESGTCIHDVANRLAEQDEKEQAWPAELQSKAEVFEDNSQSLDYGLDRRSKKPTAQESYMQKRFPDRVPVLIKQDQYVGLPDIDNKLLLLKSMTCAELRKSLPLCLSIQQESKDSTQWCLFIGDEPLKDNALMSEIYDQYIAKHDGSLHILIRAITAQQSFESETGIPDVASRPAKQDEMDQTWPAELQSKAEQ
jgi:hypothetical protein